MLVSGERGDRSCRALRKTLLEGVSLSSFAGSLCLKEMLSLRFCYSNSVILLLNRDSWSLTFCDSSHVGSIFFLRARQLFDLS